MKKLLATAVGVVSVCLAASAEDIELKGGEGTPGGITDEGGKVNVTKTGAGTHWLGGDLTFSGTLTAQQGNLTIGSGKPYSWFRLSFVEYTGQGKVLNIRQIGLYDKDGVRQNGDMIADVPDLKNMEASSGDGFKYYTIGATRGSPDNLQPGYAAYDKSMRGVTIAVATNSIGQACDLQFCFNESNGYQGNVQYKAKIWRQWTGGSGSVVPLPEAPTNWIRVVMRLKENHNPIHHFDIQTVGKNGTDAPTRMILEGSTDGVYWNTVYSNAKASDEPHLFEQQDLFNCWLSPPNKQANNGSHARPAGTGFNLSASGLVSHPVGLSSAKWWRISFTENASKILRLGQIGLYDASGVRQNDKMIADIPDLGGIAEKDGWKYYKIGKVTGSGSSDNLDNGHVAYDASMVGRMIGIYTSYSAVDINACFDSASVPSYGVKIMNEKGDASIQSVPSDPSTWIKIVMRLKDDANPIHHFDLEMLGNANSTYAPLRLRLEASLDGENWHTTWDNSDGVPFNHAYAKSWMSWLSTPDVASNTSRSRPNGTGFLVSTLHFDQLANVESVEVKEGATIEAESPVTLASLAVDGTNAGTLKGFAFAEQGTIDVTHASSGTVLPIVFSDCTDLTNLANWKVTRDGVSTPTRSIVVDNNRISVRNDAFILIFR